MVVTVVMAALRIKVDPEVAADMVAMAVTEKATPPKAAEVVAAATVDAEEMAVTLLEAAAVGSSPTVAMEERKTPQEIPGNPPAAAVAAEPKMLPAEMAVAALVSSSTRKLVTLSDIRNLFRRGTGKHNCRRR